MALSLRLQSCRARAALCRILRRQQISKHVRRSEERSALSQPLRKLTCVMQGRPHIKQQHKYLSQAHTCMKVEQHGAATREDDD
eukprot:6181070-Pleurochrysis_carterae.AAC.3